MATNKNYTEDELTAAFTLLELLKCKSPTYTIDQPIDATPVRGKVRRRRPTKKGTATIPRAILPKESPQSLKSNNCSTGGVQYVAVTYCIVSPVVSEKEVGQISVLADNNQVLNLSKDRTEYRDKNYVGNRSNIESTDNNGKVIFDEEIVSAARIFDELQRNWMKSVMC